jgi:hypothetical protein
MPAEVKNDSAKHGNRVIAFISGTMLQLLGAAAFRTPPQTASESMDEPSQNRVDLSGIHPLKRVTLLVLRFLFGVTLTIAMTTQFGWAKVCVRSPQGTYIVRTYVRGLVMCGAPDEAFPFQFLVHHGGITGDSYNEWRQQFSFWFGSEPTTFQYITSVPGLEFRRRQYPANPVEYYITLHHAWLISITATLYLFTRGRIRRTARTQSK